jgi:hypothetical protein
VLASLLSKLFDFQQGEKEFYLTAGRLKKEHEGANI